MKNTTRLTAENLDNKAIHTLEVGKEEIENAAADVTQKVKNGISFAQHKVEDVTSFTNEWVRKRPLAAIGVALGAGMLLGRAFVSMKNKRS